MDSATRAAEQRAKTRECTFCRILAGKVAAHRILEDEAALAFLDSRPLLHGHCLLVPKRHVETLADLPHDLLEPLFAAAQRLACAVERGMRADGSFVAVNNRVSQSVPHLHVHVVPRWKDDKLFSPKLIWKRRPYADEDQMAEVGERIRAALETPASERASAD